MKGYNILTNRKTTTRTFRIRQEYNVILTQEAEKQGISISKVLDNVLKQSQITQTKTSSNSESTPK